MSEEFKITISEEESLAVLERIFQETDIPYHRTKQGEEGGFFYRNKEGKLQKFTETIFIKRHWKDEHPNL